MTYQSVCHREFLPVESHLQFMKSVRNQNNFLYFVKHGSDYDLGFVL